MFRSEVFRERLPNGLQMYRKAGKNSRKIWEKRKKVEAGVVRNEEGEEAARDGEGRERAGEMQSRNRDGRTGSRWVKEKEWATVRINENGLGCFVVTEAPGG
jgi:hypothetical protein